MAMMIDPHSAAPSVFAPSIFGAALASAFAPGFLLGLGVAFTSMDHRVFPQMLILAPPFFSLAGGIVGAPFAALVFAPAILLLRKRWRLNWLATTAVGYFSVFIIALGHCVTEHTVG